MANSAVVGVLRALLTADTAQFDSAMRRASDTAKVLSRDFRQIGQQMTQVGSALTKTLTLPLVALGAGSIKTAMDFETSFANVRKTVEASKPALDAFANQIRQMAKEIPATTDELNKIAALGGQMGVPIDQLAHFTRNVAALGVAVDGINTDDAAAGLAQIGNATGTGTKNVAEMASALVHLGNKSNATEADILEFTKRLVGAGHSAGMTVPEVMALGTAMANVGINAESGGSAMSAVINKISKAVSEGGNSLQEFARVAGQSAEEFAATWKRSPIQAIDLFVKGLSSMRERGVDLNLTMGELGTEGLRVQDTLKRLSGAADGLATSVGIANEGWRTGNKHLEEAEKKYATTANQLKLLWNQIRDVGITLGNAMLPAIKSAIELFKTFLPVIDLIAKGFAALPGPIQLGVLGIAGMAAAIGPLLFVFGQLITATSTVVGAFAAKGIAARGLITVQGLLTGSTTGLTGAMGLLATATGLATLAFAGFAAGAAVALVHQRNLENLKKSAEDLGKANMLIAEKERELAIARQNGNEKLEFKLSAELKALEAGRAAALEAAKQADIAEELAKKQALAAISAAKLATSLDTQTDAGVRNVASQTRVKQATDDARIAFEKLEKQIESERAALESLGVTTLPKVNARFHELNRLWSRAVADGVPLATLVRILGPAYQELADKAKRSDVVLEGLNETLEKQKSLLPKIPSLSATIGGDLGSLLKVGVVLKDITAESMEAMRANVLAGQSFQEVGVKTVSIWKTQIFPGIKGVIDNLTAALNGSFAQMLLGAKGFKDGFLDILKSFAAAAVNIVNQVISGFTNSLMKGIQGALSGQAGAFSKAFAGLLGGGASAAAGLAGTGLATSGISAGGGFAGSFGTAGAVGAGLSSAALIGLTAGIGAAIIAGFAIYKARENTTAKSREEFATQKGFKDLGALYTQLATMGPGGQALANQGLNIIGKKDQAANERWMKDVEAFMQTVQNFTSTVTSATGNIAAGFTSKLSGLFQKQTKDQLKAYDDQIEAARDNADEVKRLETEKADFIKATQASIVTSTQEEFDRISRITLGSFTAARAQGQSAVEAVQTIGPAIDALKASADAFGFAGNAAFETLLRWRELTAANAPLLDSVTGLVDLMKVMADTGHLDKQMFADLQAQGLATYQSLIDAGFTEAEARAAIKPLIEEEIRLAQEKKLKIDEGTQAIIDQMRANGELAAEQESLVEVFKTGFGALLKFLKVDLPAGWAETARAGRGAAEDIRRHWGGMEFRVPVHFDIDAPPEFGGGLTVPGAAAGGIVTSPKLIGVGEAGPEAIIPLARLNDMMGWTPGGNFTIENRLYIDGREVTTSVVRHLREEARRQGVRPI